MRHGIVGLGIALTIAAALTAQTPRPAGVALADLAWPEAERQLTSSAVVVLPLGGVSLIDAEGQPFHDPEADAALFAALREGLSGDVELVELDCNVNDEAFAIAMADKLDAYIGARR